LPIFQKEYPENDEGGLFRTLELRNTHREFGKFNRRNLWYPLYVNPTTLKVSAESFPNSIEVFPYWNDGFEGCWTWGRPKAIEDIDFLVGKKIGESWKIYVKDYAKDATKMIKTILSDKEYFTEKGQKSFNQLFESKGKIFQSPKSVDLIKLLIESSTNKDDIVLDFFAGSGTTAHAVMDLN